MATARENGATIIMRAFPAHVRSLWQMNGPKHGDYPPQFTIECLQLAGTIVMVQQFRDGGWNAYVPATSSNRIDATLLALGDLIQVEPALKLTDHAAEGQILAEIKARQEGR